MDSNRAAKYSWALYDWANSAFATTIIAGFFPLFFKSYWADPADPAHSTFYLGVANSVASIVIAALAPFLGAIADKAGTKKKFLATFAFLGIIITGCLRLLDQGLWQWAVIFYVTASIGWSGANIFYDSLLPTVASKKEVDFISSLGYALGYIGGGILFLLNVIMYLNYSAFGLPDAATAIKISFLSVALWWGIFSIPIFLFVKEPRFSKSVSIGKAISLGWKQLMKTLRDLKHYRVVALFLLAYWLYIDGVDTIVRMAVDYGKSLDFSDSTLITALLMVQFIAFPAALGYGWIANKIGPKRAVMSGIIGYICITFLGYFMQQEWHFYFLAALVGLFQGGIQALSRSLYTRIIPIERAAEFFGFYNMLGKFAAVIGPFLMGTVTLLTGSARLGILSILTLFISGALVLWKVDIQEGEKKVSQKYS
jgi:UMF1 family MFS transporter